MFLIRYEKEKFVNAVTIQRISFMGELVFFETMAEPQKWHGVEKGFEEMFLNHLQAANNNIDNIGTRYRELLQAKSQ